MYYVYILKRNKRRIGKSVAGFTLVELLVTITIFSVVIAITAAIFFSSVQSQRKNLASQELTSQVGYVAEYISRALRMAQKDMDGTCIPSRTNYESIGVEEKAVRFLMYDHDIDGNICHELRLYETSIQELRSTDERYENFGAPLYLTSPSLIVNNAKFVVVGESQDDDIQPRVTILMEIQGQEESSMRLQTTVSQRNLDIRR